MCERILNLEASLWAEGQQRPPTTFPDPSEKHRTLRHHRLHTRLSCLACTDLFIKAIMPEHLNWKLHQSSRSSDKKKKKRKKATASTSPPQNTEKPQVATATNITSGGEALVQGYEDELSPQARESLRWEGVLEDPQAEEKRLELYRANRRQRYIAHREALLKETQCALRQTFPKESKQKKALAGCEQQEQRLN